MSYKYLEMKCNKSQTVVGRADITDMSEQSANQFRLFWKNKYSDNIQNAHTWTPAISKIKLNIFQLKIK